MITNDNDLAKKKSKKFYCKTCDVLCSSKYNYKRHILTRKHINGIKMVTNDNKKEQKGASNLMNKSLTFTYPYVNNYNNELKHDTELLLEKKGVKKSKNNIYRNEQQKQNIVCQYICSCGKSYKHKSGLSRHKKTCYMNNDDENENNILNTHNDTTMTKTELMQVLSGVMENNTKVMNDVLRQILPHVNNTHIETQNNHTNQFNINMFLNDKCKDALNFSEFIQTLPITPQLFDDTRENGLTKSLTNLLLNGLNSLNVLERPIHCTDLARKVLYVKENDMWNKDDNNDIVKGGINDLAKKQRKNIDVWQNANPGWKSNEKIQTALSSLIHNSLELCETQEKEQNKIIKAISNTTYLSKEMKDLYLLN